MAIIGVASIRVRPDLTKFRAELSAELRKIDVELKIPVTANTTRAREEIERMIRRFDGQNIDVDARLDTSQVDQASGSLRKFLSVSDTVGRSLVRNTVRAVAFSVAAGGIASSLTGTASIVGGLGSAIAAMGGAAVGVGAAGLASLVAVTATLKLGVSGLGDAFKAVAEGDAKALAEAMKNLAPAAQDFVTKTAKLKPLLDQLRLDTQTALFRGLGDEVLKTGQALQGVATRSFVGLGRAMNSTAKDVLEFVRSTENIRDLKGIADNITTGFKNASGAAKPLVGAIVDIVRSASELLPELGTGFANVTKRFAEFIGTAARNGDLTEFFRRAIETVKQFGRVLRDFGVGIGNIFKIGSDSAGGFLDILESAAASFRRFTESLGGQLVIRQIFDNIGQVAGAFGQMLGALKPLLPLVGRFASILGDSLVQILEELGPILFDLGKTLLDTLGEVLPIITPFIIELARGMGKILQAVAPLLVPLAKLLNALTPLIDPIVQLIEVLIPPLTSLIEGLTPVVKLLAEGLGLVLDAVSLLISGLTNLGTTLQLISNPFDTFEKMLGIGGKGFGTDQFKKGFRQVGHDAIEAIEEGLDGKKQTLFQTITGVIDGMVNGFNSGQDEANASGRSFMDAVNQGFNAQKQNLLNTVQSAANALLQLLTGKTPDFNTQGSTLAKAFTTGYTAEQQRTIAAVRLAIDNMIAALTGRRTDFESQGREISNRLGGGISANSGAATEAARRVGASVAGIFGGVNLFSEGASIMASLRNGLAAGIQAVKNVLTTVTSLIPTWKGPESTDKRLLTPSGIWIMRGLVEGIASQMPLLERTLTDVTDQIQTTFSPDANLTARGFSTLDVSGGLDPIGVQVDVNVNDNGMRDLIDTQITANNRTIKRFSGTGVSA